MLKNTKLSMSARYLLTYIHYKTKNPNYPFFQSNEAIGKVIGCTEASTKVLVNKLIRQGYLLKTIDERGRRNLVLSGKEFLPLDGVNMSNVEKHLLKQDIKDKDRWEKQYEQDIAELKHKLATAERERDNFNHTAQMLYWSILRKGFTVDEVDKMVAEEERLQAEKPTPITVQASSTPEPTKPTKGGKSPSFQEEQLEMFPDHINQSVPTASGYYKVEPNVRFDDGCLQRSASNRVKPFDANTANPEVIQTIDGIIAACKGIPPTTVNPLRIAYK